MQSAANTDELIQKARELAQRFGTRMCDEEGDTYGEELYCMSLDDIIDIIKLLQGVKHNGETSSSL